MLRHVGRSNAVIAAAVGGILLISAGVVLAARPETAPPAAAAPGLERAAEAAGKPVPVVPAVLAPASDEEVTSDAPDQAQAAEHPDNHGKAVSEAARASTPAEFANHGEYVRTVARANHGQEVAADHRGGNPATKERPHR